MEKRWFQTATCFFFFKHACGNIGKCTESQFGGWSFRRMIVEYLGGEGDGSAAFPNAKISDAFFQKNATKKNLFAKKQNQRPKNGQNRPTAWNCVWSSVWAEC